MSNDRVIYYANTLNQLAARLPNDDELHKAGYMRYQEGLDQFLQYRGNHEDLDSAIEIFCNCDVRPYSFAGFALIMEGASYLSGGEYDEDGLSHGLRLWKRARMIQSDRFEIEYVGTRFYSRLKQPEEVRKILDKFKQRYNKNFWYCLAEADYWTDTDERRTQYWFDRANKAAGDNRPRKLFILNRLAGNELDKPDYGDAIRLYRQVVKLDPQDPWAWHNLSYIYINQGEVDLADECNQKALSIMDFGAARSIQQSIYNARNKSKEGGLGKVIGLIRGVIGL